MFIVGEAVTGGLGGKEIFSAEMDSENGIGENNDCNVEDTSV